MPPAPGSTPIRKPITEPLAEGEARILEIFPVGSRLRRPWAPAAPRGATDSMLASTSPMANTPIATTKSMPPSSSICPKVKRDVW